MFCIVGACVVLCSQGERAATICLILHTYYGNIVGEWHASCSFLAYDRGEELFSLNPLVSLALEL